MNNRIKLITDGNFRGLEKAVGKVVFAVKSGKIWAVADTELRKHGVITHIPEYLFFEHEVKVQWPV